jgi:predicted ribonuclease YlaK
VKKHHTESRNVGHKTKIRKANLIGHILCRKSVLKHVIEGKIEGTMEVAGRRGRRHKQLLDDLREQTGYLLVKGRIPLFERGSTRSQSVQNSTLKRLRTVVRQTAE